MSMSLPKYKNTEAELVFPVIKLLSDKNASTQSSCTFDDFLPFASLLHKDAKEGGWDIFLRDKFDAYTLIKNMDKILARITANTTMYFRAD